MQAFQVNGPNLRALRELRGWSLKDLSEAARISEGHLSRAERCERDLSYPTIERIAEALGVPVGVILTVRVTAEEAVG